jgi:hypothetical protein
VAVRPARLSARSVVLAVAMCLLSACALDERQRPRDGGDLAARCEQAVGKAQAVREAGWRFTPVAAIGDEERGPLGKVVGAVWHPRERRLFVLDAFNGGVTVFDSAGRRLFRFGRIGGGPGEFEELGGSHGARPVYNQLALLGDDRIAVMELGRLHVFTTDGRFVQRMRVTDSDPGPFAVLHLAGFSDGSVLFSETGAMRLSTDDPEQRTALRLIRASVAGAEIDTVGFGGVRNYLHRVPRFTGMPPDDPYRVYDRRGWDALPSGLLAVQSQVLPGACFFDGAGRLVSASRVDAPLIQVDRAERQRVLDGVRAIAGQAPPMGARSWEAQYPVWPQTVPPYGDLALSPDSVAWLLRPLRGGGSTVDLVHARRGYLGSVQPPAGRLPLTFDSACAYVLEERVPDAGPAFYGLQRWCRQADRTPYPQERRS